MRPGDEVQIRTPNAVAAVRGTIVYVESGDAAANRPSSFTVLTGNVDVTPHGGSSVNLLANSRTLVTGNSATGTTMSAVTAVSPAQIDQILQQFEPRLTLSYDESQRRTGVMQSAQATELARALVTTITGVDPSATPGGATQVIETAQLLPTPGDVVAAPGVSGPLGIPHLPTIAPIAPPLPATPPPPPPLPPSLTISGGITDFSSGINPAFVDANISGGTLTGSDRVSVNGLTTWTDGAMTGTGITAALGGMEVGGSGTKSLDTRTLSTLGTVNLTGGVLALTNGATLSSAGAFNNSASLDLISGTALLQGGGASTGSFNVGSGSSLLFNGGVHELNSGASLTGSGDVAVVNATLNLNGGGMARLTGGLNVLDGHLNVRGSLIDVVGQSFDPTKTSLNVLGSSAKANVSVTGNVFSASQGATMTLGSAPLLASDGGFFNVGGRFFNVNSGATMTSANLGPFLEFSNSKVNGRGPLTQISGAGSQVTLGGSLLEASASSLNFSANAPRGGDLLRIDSGGQLVMTSTASPLMSFNGSNVNLGGTSIPRVIFAQGVALDPTTGLGVDRPIMGPASTALPGATNPVGTLIEVIGGGTLKVEGTSGGGTAILVDAVLLEATSPLIQLVGTGTNKLTQSTLITGGSTIDASRSSLINSGPVIALDNSLIRVTNGALITLRDGATLSVIGDLLSLTNGSRINVVNGPLILVTGSASTGSNPSVSSLTVTGALVNFGGTGGNMIVVNNNITPTATLSGIAVSNASGGGAISITNPITNPSLGSIVATGSVIQTTKGGTVTILGK